MMTKNGPKRKSKNSCLENKGNMNPNYFLQISNHQQKAAPALSRSFLHTPNTACCL